MLSRKFMTILRWILPGFPKHAKKIIVCDELGRGQRVYELKGMKWVGRQSVASDFSEGAM